MHKLFFELDGREPPAGYRIRMPPDTFARPPIEIEGISIRTASPLALYQLRAGIAHMGSFGPLSEQQLRAMARLRDTLLANRSEAELRPHIEPLR